MFCILDLVLGTKVEIFIEFVQFFSSNVKLLCLCLCLSVNLYNSTEVDQNLVEDGERFRTFSNCDIKQEMVLLQICETKTQ